MFWDFGSAVSSQQQAAGDHVQKSASRNPQQQKQLQDPQQRARSSTKCLQATTRSPRQIVRDVKEDVALHCFGLRHIAQIDFGKFRQGEHIRVPPRIHHHCRRRTFPSHRTYDKSFQSIMKCDDICKDLHGSVMLFTGTDALQGIGERMTKDQNAV